MLPNSFTTGELLMFRQMTTEKIALLLHGLRAIYVADQEKDRQELIKVLEGTLASRGVSLPEAN